MLTAKFTGAGEEAALLDMAAIKAAFVADAREGTETYRRQNARGLRREVGVVPITDGRRGAGPETVKLPGGLYIAEYQLGEGVIEAGLEILRRVSPVQSGRYKRSHKVFAGGREVSGPPWPEITGEGQIFIADIAPYARVLEASWPKSRPSRQAPQGPYRLAALALTRLFGDVYRFRFAFVALEDIQGELVSKRAGRRGRASRAKAVYPAIYVAPR